MPLSNRACTMDPFVLHIDRSKDNAVYYSIPVIGTFFRWRLKVAVAMFTEARVHRLLDIGYGAGLLIGELAGRADQMVCVDVHDYHVEVRRQALRDGYAIDAARGDASALPFAAEAFDAVFCVSLLEHVTDLQHVVQEIRRVLQPNGTLIAGFPPRSSLTSACFRAIGFDYARLHPNGETAILSALASCFAVERVIMRPRVAPLYVVTRCTRKE